ncbi:MAG: Acetylornithine aminotransferase [Rhizobium sp.]|nr:Acetylornithine aminotransferase [Rhizobium sp.]
MTHISEAPVSSTDQRRLKSAIFPCFSRADVSFTHGDGTWLTAADGRRYLDFAPASP